MNRRRPAQAESHPRIFAGGWPGLSCSLRRLGQFGEALRTNMHSRLPPFRTERGRMGHPSCLCDLDLHLDRVATFQSQVSSKNLIWELSGCRPFGEEHVVVLAAVEGRVEVDEVYRLVLDVLTQDFEIVAVIELIFLHWGKILTRIGGLRNCSSGCVVGMPGGVIVERTDAGSFDSVADSLREPATALGMTVLGWFSLCGRSRLPPFRKERGRVGHPML